MILVYCASLINQTNTDRHKAREILLRTCEDGIELCRLRGSCLDRQNLAKALVQLALIGPDAPDRELLLKAQVLLKGLCLEHPENKQYQASLHEVDHLIRIWPGTTE